MPRRGAGSRKVRQGWLLPSVAVAQRQQVADVVVRAPVPAPVPYAVPAELLGRVALGTPVRVPLRSGRRLVEGVCVGVAERPWDQTRPPIAEVTGPPWPLSARLVTLGLWLGEYYACPPWKVFAAMLPIGLRRPPACRVEYFERGPAAAPARLTPRQQAVLTTLAAAGPLPRRELAARAGVSAAVLRRLLRAGLLTRSVRTEVATSATAADLPGESVGPAAVEEDGFVLTAGQQAALDEIVAAAGPEPAFRVFVLFGVPGSGKTEVYVRAIRAVVAAGRQAVLLVPEIALTTQLVARLRRRFGRVAVLHSRLTPRERLAAHVAIAAGACDVVLGTRTAVFAPCPRLGLLVVDEEQEGSFKNLAAPYFHARDVAVRRAQLEGVPVVLGSATPALDTWYNVQRRPHYRLLRLPERVPGAQLPVARLACTPAREEGVTLLSVALLEQLRAVRAAGGQAILLHNRRGFAVALRCARCGQVLSCAECGVALVFHKSDGRLRCHRCGRAQDAPARCRDDTCGGRLERRGAGVQRLEDELRTAVPGLRLLRLDRDTMRRRSDYEAALRAFEEGAADVLLGTQMIAKGLDFPRVRLVGVIDADAALAVPDFRAAERVFQLIVQVVGRAGRRAGESLALVQCRRPTAAVADALRVDYESFAARELDARRAAGWPPWTRLARIVIADDRPGRARDVARRLAAELRTLAGRIDARLRVDPAEPCVLPRLRGLLRYQVLLRGPRDAALTHLLRAAADNRLLRPATRRCAVDVDPLDLL